MQSASVNIELQNLINGVSNFFSRINLVPSRPHGTFPKAVKNDKPLNNFGNYWRNLFLKKSLTPIEAEQSYR